MPTGGQGKLHLGVDLFNKTVQDQTDPDDGQFPWTCATQRIEGKKFVHLRHLNDKTSAEHHKMFRITFR